MQFFKRKMWTYNLGIHNIKTGKASLFLWNEPEGKRGSSDFASCLEKYIQANVGQEVKTLVLFSDNSGGQNKNLNLVLCLLRYIHSGRFDSIEHYFMILGHSFLPCDL